MRTSNKANAIAQNLDRRKVKRDKGLLKSNVVVFSSISPPTIEEVARTLTNNPTIRIVAMPISSTNFSASQKVNIVKAGVETMKTYAPKIAR